MSKEDILELPLSEAELLTLWHAAWLVFRRNCKGTLIRLNRGLGGLYEAADLRQDAYLTFRALALRWAQQDPRPPESELWSAWRRTIQHGGSAILRRPPQRLWDAAPLQDVDLEDVADDPSLCHDAALVRAVSEQLVDGTEPDEAIVQADDAASERAAMGRALAALQPAQPRIVIAVVLEGRSIQGVAAELGIGREAARMRLARALAALRRHARLTMPSPGADVSEDGGRDACARGHRTS